MGGDVPGRDDADGQVVAIGGQLHETGSHVAASG
jgi:hypothetical protein